MVCTRSMKTKTMNQSVEDSTAALLKFIECKVEELKKMPSSLLGDEFCQEVPKGINLLGQSIQEACKDSVRIIGSFVSMAKESQFLSILRIAKWQRETMDASEECELLTDLLGVEPTASLKNIDRLRTIVTETKEYLRGQCQILQDMFAELISMTRKVIDEQKKRNGM